LCFVLMPFGTKPDPAGGFIDFDAVYQSLIKPAVLAAGMDPVRADEEELGGIIHKPMFERLILCDYAVADLTAANANVFYEFGVRHGIRPRTTVSVFAEGTRLPFDVTFLRGVTYGLDAGVPSRPEADSAKIAAALSAAKQDAPDSPVYQLITDLAPTDISHLNTDVFRDRVDYARDIKHRLHAARQSGKPAVDAVRDEIGDIGEAEAGVVIDLLLSYRAVGEWDAMIALVDEMSDPIKRSVLVREQLGLALNRAGRRDEAEQVLRQVIEENGPSSETYGLLGRVHKDRWEEALQAGNEFEARGHLKAAIEAYRRGFEADWRDAYPGINAVTLMELTQPPDPARIELLPVVLYSAGRRIAGGTPNYWDHATLLELAVLRNNPDAATDHAQDALAAAEEQWQPETTLRNLRLIQRARQDRNEDTGSMTPIVEALDRKAQELRGPDG
jgi:tetratricopeptide (TPR) repeat protein